LLFVIVAKVWIYLTIVLLEGYPFKIKLKVITYILRDVAFGKMWNDSSHAFWKFECWNHSLGIQSCLLPMNFIKKTEGKTLICFIIDWKTWYNRLFMHQISWLNLRYKLNAKLPIVKAKPFYSYLHFL